MRPVVFVSCMFARDLLQFARDSPLEGDGFELPVPEPARRCPKDFGSSPSTVRTSAACNRISGPAPDCRSADTGIRRTGRRRPPRCSGYAYHSIARRAAAGLHRLGAAGEDRYTVPALLPCQTAPYRHTLGGALIRPDLPEPTAQQGDDFLFNLRIGLLRLLRAALVPGMRIARHLDAQRVDRGVRATEQRPQLRSAEREVDGLLRPPDDADARAVRCHDPDAARPSAINPANAVDLEAVGDAQLTALVEVGEDAAANHVAGRVEPDRVDVLREAHVRDIHRALVWRQREPVGVFAICQDAQTAVRRQAIDAGAVPQVVLPRRTRYFALVVGTALVRIGEIQTPVRVTDHIVRPVEAPAFVVVDKRLDLAVRAHARQAPIVSFADDQAALQVEGRAVAADGGPDELRLLAGCKAQQLIAAKIDEIPVAVRMPQRAFGEDEAGGKVLRFSGFEHLGQVIGDGHR